MQSNHQIFTEGLLLAAKGEDHFDHVPDSVVSRRFNALVVDDVCLRIDCVIPAGGADGGSDAPGLGQHHSLMHSPRGAAPHLRLSL
nr:unnamed protein product [Digitaria exilis]